MTKNERIVQRHEERARNQGNCTARFFFQARHMPYNHLNNFKLVCSNHLTLKTILFISPPPRAKLDRVKRIWYLSPMRAAKVQANLRIRAVSPEPSLLAHTSSESRGTFRQKARSLAPLNGWACAVKICHDGMLEDTNSLDGAQFMLTGIRYHEDKPHGKCNQNTQLWLIRRSLHTDRIKLILVRHSGNTRRY